MKNPLSGALVLAVVIGGLVSGPRSAAAAAIQITPSAMGDWAFDNRDVNGVVGANTTGAGELVNGPSTPPAGTGSARLATGNGTIGGDGTWELRNTGFDGVLISALTALSYSTYSTQNNGQQFPYFGLHIADSASANTTILFFEPPYQTPATGNPGLPNQGDPALNTWQTWDAFAGGWWSSGGECGGGGGTNVESFAACITALGYTDPFLKNPGTLGAIRFNVGFASDTDQFNGYVDNFTIGVNGANTTFDFELAEAQPVPEPATLSLLGLGLVGLARRYRRPSA